MSINDLRVGTKLAIASGVGILLVTGMLFNQWRSDGAVDHAVHSMTDQKEISFRIAIGQGNFRQAQVNVRDIRLASDVEALNKLVH